MQNTLKSIFALLILATAFSACTREKAAPDVSDQPILQLSGNCASLGPGNFTMEAWASAIEVQLNSDHRTFPKAHHNCSAPVQTVTKTYSVCWPTDMTYTGQEAANNMCDLIAWAKNNKPDPITGNTPVTLTKWYITNYSYWLDQTTSCGSSAEESLKLTVTYTAYRCDLTIESVPVSYEIEDFQFVARAADPNGPSDGTFAFVMRPIKDIPDGDDESDDGDDSELNMNILKETDNTVIGHYVATTYTGPDGVRARIEFAVDDFSLVDVKFDFYLE